MKALSNISNRINTNLSWSEGFIGVRYDRETKTLSLNLLPFVGLTCKFGKITAKEIESSPFTPEDLRLFLLDAISDERQEEIAVWIASVKSSEIAMEMAEDDLIDDYLRDALTGGEKILFEKCFLISEARVHHLQQNVLLKNFSRRKDLLITTANN